MQRLPATTLHVCVDADLASSFDVALGIAADGRSPPEMPQAPSSSPFLFAGASASSPASSRSLAARTPLSASAHRAVLPTSQTILLFTETEQPASAGGPSLFPSSLTHHWTRVVDLCVVMDTTQVPAFLTKAATTACATTTAAAESQRGEGTTAAAEDGALGAYLSAVCQATVAADLSLLLPCPSACGSPRGVRDRLRVHVLVAPGVLPASAPSATAAAAAAGMTTTASSPSLSANQAAGLLAGVVAASCGWSHVRNDTTDPSSDDFSSSSFTSSVQLSLGACVVLPSAGHIAEAVAAVANKRLKGMLEDAAEAQKGGHSPTLASLASAGAGPGDQADEGEDDFDIDVFGLDKSGDSRRCLASPPPAVPPLPSETLSGPSLAGGEEEEEVCVDGRVPVTGPLSLAWLRHVRPDTARKCEPYDFARLYATMLSEVSSFSERKVLAAVGAFPTMHHLLSYLHTERLKQQQERPGELVEESDGGLSPSPPLPRPGAVYSAGFGDSRQWNVLNEAIVAALMEDYRGE